MSYIPGDRNYLFVDGSYLQQQLDYYSSFLPGRQLEPRLEQLRKDSSSHVPVYEKVFFYDSLPPRQAEETEAAYEAKVKPKRDFLDGLSNLDGFHVYYGQSRLRQNRSKREPRIEQKQVDIMIAVDMLTHAFQKNMRQATLLTGDLDFQPLLQALVLQGLFVTLWYCPRTAARDLMLTADGKMPFTVETFLWLVGNPVDQVKFATKEDMESPPSSMTVTEWTCDRLGKAKLFQNTQDNRFGVIFRSPNHRQPHILWHKEKTFLLRCAEERFGLSMPPE